MMTNHGLSSNKSFRHEAGFSSRITDLGQRVWRWLSSGDEVQIHQLVDREGHPRWRVFDPTTGQSSVLFSERDVVIWLEDRYSQSTAVDWTLNYTSMR